MKSGVTLFSILSALLFSSFAFAEDDCFDPRAVLVSCPAGTQFSGWNKGLCEGALVQGPVCVDECFDPRTAFVTCKKGQEFKGWDFGTCSGGLVKGPICSK